MNGVQTRFKCKLDVKRCKRFVFPPSSLLPRSNALKTKAIRYFQTDRTLTRIVSPPLCDTIPRTVSITGGRNSLMERLKLQVCELCGATDKLEMHHVRKLKDLKGKSDWEKRMIARRRKTLAVCSKCHAKIDPDRRIRLN